MIEIHREKRRGLIYPIYPIVDPLFCVSISSKRLFGHRQQECRSNVQRFRFARNIHVFALLSRGNRVEGLDVVSRHVGYISKKQKGEALGASDTVVT